MKRKYRFLFVSVPFSGIEVFFRKLQNQLASINDIECHWIWIERDPKDFIGRIPPFSMNWTLKASAIARRRVRLLEKQHGPFDAAIFNNVMPATFLGEFTRRVPFGISMDCTPALLASEPYRTWFRGRRQAQSSIFNAMKLMITKRVYADASFLLPYSSVARASLLDVYGVDENKIDIVPLGVDVTQWSQDLSTRTPEEKPSKLSVLFIGGNFERKGGDLMLRMAQRVEFADCTFHFLTDNHLTLSASNICVHTNVKPNSRELMQLYANADVFVMPTRADFAQTNAVLEAMAMRIPVITTNIGGLDEVVIDGQTGYIVAPDDEKRLSERLFQLKTSSALRHQFGEMGRTKAENEFSLSASTEKIITHLKRAAQSRLQ